MSSAKLANSDNGSTLCRMRHLRGAGAAGGISASHSPAQLLHRTEVMVRLDPKCM